MEQNSRPAAIPSPCGDAEQTQLLNFFPEELWRLILAKAWDVKDYFRLCRTSPFFKSLLASQRKRILLSTIAQILVHRRESREPEFDYPYPRIDLKDLAVCRQVSRDWKQGIERTLHNLPYFHQFFEEFEHIDLRFLIDMYFKFWGLFKDESEFSVFESYFRDSHLAGVNPFITRTIQIQLPCNIANEPLHKFITSCLHMLRQYGKHIWHIAFLGSLNTEDWLPVKLFSHFLRDVLEQVPNLRRLKFHLRNSFKHCEPLDGEFPRLKKLDFLDLEGISFRIGESILKSNKPTHVGLPYSQDSSSEEAAFKAFCQLSTPVSKLKVHLCLTHLNWDEIFHKLETNFGNTLTSLHISLPGKDWFVESRELQLPHLKYLHLYLEEGGVPLDFLLGVANTLEHFSVSKRDMMDNTKTMRERSQERKIKFYEFIESGRLFMSNIWECLPKLQKLTIRPRAVCSRKDWKDNMLSYNKYWSQN